MKKLLLGGLAMTVLMFTVVAQKLDAIKVPAAVKSSFAKQFPGASVQWKKEDAKYEAEFKVKGNAMSAVFDAKGNLDETEADIKRAELPSKVLAYLKEHYKGKNIEETAKITKADGTVNYEVEIGGKDINFDAGGGILKIAKD